MTCCRRRKKKKNPLMPMTSSLSDEPNSLSSTHEPLLKNHLSGRMQDVEDPSARPSSSSAEYKSCCCALTRCLRFSCWTLPILLWDGVRLLVFVVVLSPAFCKFAWFYMTTNKRVERYQTNSCRQSLDIYPTSSTGEELSPVVIFLTGGAWMIGYKMWGALIAKALVPMGIMVIIPDYRNYPWATVPSMINDVDHAIQWTFDNCERYGGDPDKVVVVGQSAGGHLATCAILRRALLLAANETEDGGQHNNSSNITLYKATDIKGFMALSAPSNLQALRYTFRQHGLDEHLVVRIFDDSLEECNPHYQLQNCSPPNSSWAEALPPIVVLHGCLDKTVPHEGSELFTQDLCHAGVDAEFISYPLWSHTDAILEGPMNADHCFHRHVLEHLKRWTNSPDLIFDETAPSCRRMCPAFMITVARFVNPF